MNKSSFLIVGQHDVIEDLRKPKRKVLKVFLIIKGVLSLDFAGVVQW